MAQRGDTSARWRHPRNLARNPLWTCAFLGVLLAACNHLGTAPRVQAPPAPPARRAGPPVATSPPAQAARRRPPYRRSRRPAPHRARPGRRRNGADHRRPTGHGRRRHSAALERPRRRPRHSHAAGRRNGLFRPRRATPDLALLRYRRHRRGRHRGHPNAALDAGADLLLGPVFAPAVRAAADARGGAAVPILAFSNDAPVAGDGVFILGPRPEEQIARVLRHAADQGVRHLGRVRARQHLWRFGRETVAALAPQLGVTVTERRFRAGRARRTAENPRLRRLSTPQGRLAGRTQSARRAQRRISKRALRRLEGLDSLGDPPYEAVLLPVGGAELRRLAPHFAYYDIDPRRVRYLGTALWNDPTLSTEPALRGGTLRPLIQTMVSPSKSATKRLLIRPRQALPRWPSMRSRWPPSCNSAPTRGARLHPSRLTQASGFSGVTGLFRLLPNGLNQRGLALMTITANGLETLDPAPSRFDDVTD